MWWFIIGFVVFIVIVGLIGSTVEQRQDEEFRKQSVEQLGKLAEWWYSKK